MSKKIKTLLAENKDNLEFNISKWDQYLFMKRSKNKKGFQ
jgi:hypothetical protein